MPNRQKLGRIIGYTDHADYLVSIFRKGEIDQGPEKDDHAIGRYVTIGNGNTEENGEKGEETGESKGRGGRTIVGVIISSQLVSEEGLRAGVSDHGMPSGDMSLFTPELMDGSMSVVQVRGIGTVDEQGDGILGTPSTTPSYQDTVAVMSDGDVAKIHSQDGKLHLEYLKDLESKGGQGTRTAVINALKRLEGVLPEHSTVLDLIRKEIEWKQRMND